MYESNIKYGKSLKVKLCILYVCISILYTPGSEDSVLYEILKIIQQIEEILPA